MVDELGIPFPLLSDQALDAALAYGVAMEGRDIALPAVFVITQDGEIAWRTVGEALDDRPSLAEILAELDKLPG